MDELLPLSKKKSFRITDVIWKQSKPDRLRLYCKLAYALLCKMKNHEAEKATNAAHDCAGLLEKAIAVDLSEIQVHSDRYQPVSTVRKR